MGLKKKRTNSFFNSKTENLEILHKRYSQCRFSESLRQADHSSRGVLPSACVCVCARVTECDQTQQ